MPADRLPEDFKPAAIAGWNVRADTYEDFERARQAVAMEAALWRARLARVLAPCPN